MKRVNCIINDEEYRTYLLKNKAYEEHRQFCTHDFEHMLGVARLAYTLLLEEGCFFITKEVVYAAGLLHDIGRWKEYQDGTDHAVYSAELASLILKRSGFTKNEEELIVEAIAQHRNKSDKIKGRSPLSRALLKADALVRLCFQCSASKDCKRIASRPHTEDLLY